jgi:23S rRNA (pseudouridine1915-N3)-methyltransferase
MFNITILAVGSIKEPYIKSGIKEYEKRLKPFAKINVVELKNEPFDLKTRNKSIKEEGERILDYLKKFKGIIIAMDERGDNFTSVEFARFLESFQEPIIFIVGGALGLDKRVVAKAHHTISLSQLTFPHEFARLVLFEQIYRAVTIIKNKIYHY